MNFRDALLSLMNGATMACCWMLALVFYRFWRRGRDRFFALFSLSFVLMGTERLLLGMVDSKNEFQPFCYLLRLTAFLIIIVAVADKNRAAE